MRRKLWSGTGLNSGDGPRDFAVRSPANISTMEEARMLRDALQSGECVWVKLTSREKEARAKSRKEKIASGEVVVKERKQRSDKGKRRGPKSKITEEGDKENEDEEEGTPPKKRQRRSKGGAASKAPPMPKSSEFVDDEEDED
ncbi:hypothetical protein FPV67DRAFT_1449158 [Lyophyllum atratum]|nr:hypothetical protein FPV67DRAFT_1449158 [Lyophyllum atratum]